MSEPAESQSAKAETIRQWTSQPAGAHLASQFEPGSREFYDAVERTRYELYPWLLHEYLSDPSWADKAVLEIGVGLGTDHLQLTRAGARLTGIDLTPASVAHTKHRFSLVGETTTLLQADAEQLPFDDEQFDGVYSFGVLHHTPDMQRAIDEVWRVLRPGGTVVIGLYNRHSYFHAWRLLRHVVRGDVLRKSLAQMRSEFEFGEGAPLVRLSSRAELQQAFARFGSVEIEARHLPLNRLPIAKRANVGERLRPLERRFGWYWMVKAAR